MVDRIVLECGDIRSPDALVDTCLDIVGPMAVSEETRDSIVEVASRARDDLQGDGQGNGRSGNGDDEQRIVDVLKMIVSSREYQLC